MKIFDGITKQLLRILRPEAKIHPEELSEAIEEATGENVSREDLEAVHASKPKERRQFITQFLPVFFDRDIKALEKLDTESDLQVQARNIVIETLRDLSRLTSSPSTFHSRENSSSKRTKPKITKQAHLKKLEIKVLRRKLKQTLSAKNLDRTSLIPSLKYFLKSTNTLSELAKDRYLFE